MGGGKENMVEEGSGDVMYPTTNIFNNNKNIQIKTEILLYLHNIHFLKTCNTRLIIDNLIFKYLC